MNKNKKKSFKLNKSSIKTVSGAAKKLVQKERFVMATGPDEPIVFASAKVGRDNPRPKGHDFKDQLGGI